MSLEAPSKATLARLLTEARAITRARAGSVYLREENRLTFVVAQNDDLELRLGDERALELLTRSPLATSRRSVASYVALTRSTVNIADAYAIPGDKPYSFNPELDLQTGFRTVSMLVLPIRAPTRAILGVLQLINATNPDGKVVPFDPAFEKLLKGLCVLA
jgi:GAF domain-containing protein